MDWKIVKDKIKARREAIWFDMPEEIKRISVGENARGTCVYNQYFTVLMFAEGEMRTLSDEVLWHLRSCSCNEEMELKSLVIFAKSILTYKMQFLSFVGLDESSELLNDYLESLDTIKTKEEFCELTDEMLMYINRAHMWVDMVFPWGVSMGFQKKAK